MEKDLFSEIVSNSGVRIAIIGSLAILALFLLAETASIAQDFGRPSNPATDTITVSADGQATLPPDVARVSFMVENTAKAVSDAQAQTTKQANAAIDYVKQQGVADKDIQTLSYNISPQYSYTQCPPSPSVCPPSTPTITGYQVSETIQVTMHDLTHVGTLVSGLGNLQVQNVSGPSFGLEDTTAGYDAARADAIAKAKAQALNLERELGVEFGRIVNFSESNGSYPQPVMYAAGLGGAADMKAASTPTLPTGENTYHASVTITYEIR